MCLAMCMQCAVAIQLSHGLMDTELGLQSLESSDFVVWRPMRGKYGNKRDTRWEVPVKSFY